MSFFQELGYKYEKSIKSASRGVIIDMLNTLVSVGENNIVDGVK